MASLPQLASLASLAGGASLPNGPTPAPTDGPNALDAQAQRYQGISDTFKNGQLTPLTAILKGVTGQVAQSKSEKAQSIRDQKQAQLDKLNEWKWFP